jgi:flagellar biogenesis protein FliO
MITSVKPTIVRRLIPIALATLCMLGRASAQQLPQALPPAYEPPRAAEMRRDPEVAPAAYTSTPGTLAPTPGTLAPQVPAAEQPVPIGLKPAEAKSAKKLSLPGSNRDGDKSADKPNAAGGLSGVFSVLGSLGVVLGLFLMMAWLMRRGLPKQGRMLPREAVESLGRIPFPGRQQGQLLRVGNKLILVSFSNSGADVIAEITDPLEVDRLSGLCAQADRYSSVKTFRDVVDQFFGEKPGRREAARQATAAKIKERDVA